MSGYDKRLILDKDSRCSTNPDVVLHSPIYRRDSVCYTVMLSQVVRRGTSIAMTSRILSSWQLIRCLAGVKCNLGEPRLLDKDPIPTKLMAFEDKLRPMGGGLYSYAHPPATILLSKKLHDIDATRWLNSVAGYLKDAYGAKVLIDAGSSREHSLPVMQHDQTRDIDLVVALGGDGTLLHVSSYFTDVVPPVCAFSKGSLGFLMPFRAEQWREVLDNVMKKQFRMRPRRRLMCQITRSEARPISKCRFCGESEAAAPKVIGPIAVVNEMSINRNGSNPLMLTIALDGRVATTVLGDGMVAATPTGSTAYSLSAGGSIVHPDVDGTLLTPVCPFSLSFRPLVLPANTHVELIVPSTSRSSACISFDGRNTLELGPGDTVSVRPNEYPIPCIEPEADGIIEWINNISQHLKWNVTPSHY